MYKPVIVTGAAGYIGSVLCKMLKEQGYYIIGVDNAFHSSDHERIEKVKKYCNIYKSCDFIDDKFLEEFIRPDTTVFHLAANSLLGPSAFHPADYYLNNTVKTLKLINFMGKRRCKRLIFASTAAVYSEKQIRPSIWNFGQNPEQMCSPVQESDIIAPPNNYGMSKLMSEQMLDSVTRALHNEARSFHSSVGMQVFSFRFFNVIGGYQELGPREDTPHIISQLIKSYKDGTPFRLNGADFKTKDGTCVRDYVHVMDVCRAMMHANVWGEDHYHSSETRHYKFNLGTGIGHSNKEVIASFNKIVSPHLDKPAVVIKNIGPRVGDPPYLVADPTLFKEQTGFVYKYSNSLDTMIQSAWSSHNV